MNQKPAERKSSGVAGPKEPSRKMFPMRDNDWRWFRDHAKRRGIRPWVLFARMREAYDTLPPDSTLSDQ